MDLIRDFKDPGREYSVLAFWFLNGELKKERLAWRGQGERMQRKRILGHGPQGKCTQHQPYSGSSSRTGCAVRIRDLRKSRRHLFES